MSITVHYVRACDRCSTSLDTSTTSDVKQLPVLPERKTFKLTLGDSVLIEWQDICPKCQKVVDGLIDRIRLVSKKDDQVAQPATSATPASSTTTPIPVKADKPPEANNPF